MAAAIATLDPVRAHGAWVYLFASVGGGALIGAGQGVERALLVGTGFAGAFLCAAALAVGAGRKPRQLVVGAVVGLASTLAALSLGAEPVFLAVAGLAVVPATGAVLLGSMFGYLSPAALAAGIGALVLAAPAVALSGGTSVGRALALFVLLWPFACWRSLRIAAPLQDGATWRRSELRIQGLREAGLMASWTLVVVTGLTWSA